MRKLSWLPRQLWQLLSLWLSLFWHLLLVCLWQPLWLLCLPCIRLWTVYKIKKKQTLSVKLKGCFFGAETLAVGRGFIPWALAGAHSLAWATLHCQDTVGIMFYRVSMLDETVETRRPWRGSPWTAIRGSSFLCIVCIIQQYLSSFAIRSWERACPSWSQGMKPLTLWQNRIWDEIQPDLW